MKGFEDLKVWQRSCRLVVDIYKLFSGSRDYGFKDQICRSALSVPSNIAEGYERNSSGDFVRFLNIAKGSCGELKTQIYIAGKLGYINNEQLTVWLNETREIAAMLSGLIKNRKINSKQGAVNREKSEQ